MTYKAKWIFCEFNKAIKTDWYKNKQLYLYDKPKSMEHLLNSIGFPDDSKQTVKGILTVEDYGGDNIEAYWITEDDDPWSPNALYNSLPEYSGAQNGSTLYWSTTLNPFYHEM